MASILLGERKHGRALTSVGGREDLGRDDRKIDGRMTGTGADGNGDIGSDKLSFRHIKIFSQVHLHVHSTCLEVFRLPVDSFGGHPSGLESMGIYLWL